jgi:gluconokinase
MSDSVVPCTIGLDLGTTTIKALAFTEDGQEIARATAAPTTLVQDERAEQDPQEVYARCLEVLAETTSIALQNGHRVARVGISAAMHSLLAVSADGAPLTRAVLWMDGRAQLEAEALWATKSGQSIYARTGTPIHAMSPLAKLLWLRQNEPDIWSLSARFVSLKEWIWYRWFNTWEIDASIASATGLYNLQTGDWDAEALQLAAVKPAQLSLLVPTTFTRQGIREPVLLSAGLSETTWFTIGANDGVLANLGMDAIDPSALVLTIGTSSAVRRGSPGPCTNPATRSFCYVLDHDRFIIGAASNSGGVVLDWLARQLCRDVAGPESGASAGEAPWLQLLDEASQVSTDGLYFLPYVAGERAPLWDADASGLFWGLRLHHQPAHLVRAAVLGILFNARWLADDITSSLPAPFGLYTTGGVLRERWIQQLAAEIFQLPVYEGSHSDASSRGAALIADIAAGQAKWPTALPDRSPVVVPSPDSEYPSQYRRFREICALVRG